MKTAVCVLIIKDKKVLSVSRKNDLSDFGLVGGKCESYETLLDCAVREVQEEVGLNVKEEDLVPVFHCFDSDYFVTTYIALHWDGNINSQEEALIKWLSPNFLATSGSFKKYNEKLFKHLGILNEK